MNLQNLVKNYKLFIDTSTWMFPDSQNFLSTELPHALLEAKEQIKVPVRIIEEVNRLMTHEKRETRHKAKKAAALLKSYFDHEIARAFGSSSDPFADQTILYVFQQFRVKYNLALITQDRGLALDTLNLNNQHAVQGKRIYVYRINESGAIEEWNPERIKVSLGRDDAPSRPIATTAPVNEKRTSGSHKPESETKPWSQVTRTRPATAGKKPKPNEMFAPGTRVITQKETVMQIGKVPDIGETVYSKVYGALHLQKEVGSGGEGKIFVSNNGMVCKIYKRDRITHERYHKLKRMLEVPIDKPGICWPKDIITNGSSEFVGYIMEVADGKPMQTAMFQKPVLEKNFPKWTRKDLVQLAISILGKIAYLHERNIIIGDLNPLNILIKNEKEVYFVDTDSYQIENYPCPVGTINFTAPTLQGKNFSTFLRTFEDEYFAVSTLVFMILHPGKPPYSQLGGGSPGENIKKMEFPYPCGEKGKGTAPDGPWKYIWSHLPYKLKEALYDTFTGEKRATPEELRDLLVEYRQLISNGKLGDELFPSGHKIPKDKEAIVTCTDRNCTSPTVIVHIDFKEKVEKRGGRFVCDPCKLRRKYEKQMRTMGMPGTSHTTNQRNSGQYPPPRQNNPRPTWVRPQPVASNTGSTQTKPNTATKPRPVQARPQPAARTNPGASTQPKTFLDRAINILKKFQ
ncbi:hypothetical protein [Mesobacillus harenae]|uniref:hypothetical protein n=1 Tax=Mesobacillus harenae TaxID=2213203 RepID=UPI0015811055|nr:hypothetical protein [Mesobacillus harenae]